jgi:Tat protein translocase TatB subunit
MAIRPYCAKALQRNGIEMFDIGGSEFLLILLVALIFLGPEHLPDVARKLARIVREIRRAGDEVRMHVDPDGELYRAMNLPPSRHIPLISSLTGDDTPENKKEEKKIPPDDSGKKTNN